MTEREALVEAALSQRGAENGRKYVAWYNAATGTALPLSCAWCAIFVSWCARQAGIGGGQIPNFAGCTTGRSLFKKMGIWRDRELGDPRRGDLVLFDWDGDPSLAEHVGIVTGFDGSYVSTVEGNSGGTVREKRYPKGSPHILGYAVWKEKEGAEMTREETQRLVDEALAGYARAPKVYHSLREVPEWARETAQRLVDQGRLRGDPAGDLALTDEMLRVLVILERKEQV